MGKDTLRKTISVIIPVYNVQDYLDQCLESVCNQTYSQLEIILVDDGSTDDSGTMCDEWAKRDARIVVVHKGNGGLSDARNVGMRVAQGDYIGFVDSDDWIELDMYERMLKCCEEYSLDLVLARFCEETETDLSKTVDTYTNEFVILSCEKLNRIYAMGGERISVSPSVWDRLYKKEILEGLEFPTGKKYEDLCYSTEVMLRVDKAGYIDAPLYHYRIRKDSIMGGRRESASDIDLATIDDLLSQMKARANIYYREGLRDYGDRVFFEYLYKLLTGLTYMRTVKKNDEKYKFLKKQFYSNRKWIIGYICRTKTWREKAILLVSGISVEVYRGLVGLVRR